MTHPLALSKRCCVHILEVVILFTQAFDGSICLIVRTKVNDSKCQNATGNAGELENNPQIKLCLVSQSIVIDRSYAMKPSVSGSQVYRSYPEMTRSSSHT